MITFILLNYLTIFSSDFNLSSPTHSTSHPLLLLLVALHLLPSCYARGTWSNKYWYTPSFQTLAPWLFVSPGLTHLFNRLEYTTGLMATRTLFDATCAAAPTGISDRTWRLVQFVSKYMRGNIGIRMTEE